MARDGIRIASYNTHGGIGRDGHFVPKRIADVLKELDADVIALQEVENRATGFDMLEYLKGETGFEAIAGPTLLRRGADYGNGLLTRFKVLSVQRIDLCVERCEPRGAIDVELDCGGTPMRVLATHLGLRPVRAARADPAPAARARKRPAAADDPDGRHQRVVPVGPAAALDAQALPADALAADVSRRASRSSRSTACG